MEWFANWFDSEYYHILYQHRNDNEARFFIDNLIRQFNPEDKSIMMDLACGKGRHSIYLAEKGYDVTGLDLSEQSIAHASKSSHDHLHFYVHDMRRKFRSNYYDFIFNFFTSFGYFSKEIDHNLTLDAISNGLKSNGIFVMDFINAVKAENNLIHKETKKVQDITFNIRRKVEKGNIIKNIQFTDQGKEFHFQESVRGFRIYEMTRMFRKHGMDILHIYGDYDLTPFDVATSNRMILISQKR